MRDISVSGYLDSYKKKTNPLLEDYLNLKIKEAEKIGSLPAALLRKFAEIAKKGKRIRGALLVLGYEIGKGRNINSAYDVSLFIELMHTGLLIHDDVMDNDSLRRGLKAVHTLYHPLDYGRSMAINAGDIAFYLSWDKLVNSKFPPDKLIQAAKIYSEYLPRVIHGQVLDISSEAKEEPSEGIIMNTLKYKTAEYTGVFPLLTGAALAGLSDSKKLNAIKKYGLSLGWVFQIQDDILGLYGEEKIGKPIGSDLREGKKTLFIDYLLKRGTNRQKDFILSLLGSGNIKLNDFKKAQRLFKEIGAYDYVIQLGWKYVNEGKKTVDLITENSSLRKLLTAFIVFMIERTT